MKIGDIISGKSDRTTIRYDTITVKSSRANSLVNVWLKNNVSETVSASAIRVDVWNDQNSPVLIYKTVLLMRYIGEF